MIIGYLCNRYPAASHSFIRREIAGIESLGHEVVRFTLRRGVGLADPDDYAEARKTTVLLSAWLPGLLYSLLLTAVSRPLAFMRSIGVAWRAGTKGGARVRNFAYLVEACLLRRLLTKAGATHLHAHFGTNPAAVARLVRSLGGPPFSFTVHGPDEFDRPTALDLEGKVNDAEFTIAISDFGRSQLMRWSDPQAWSKIKVVRCGVDGEFLGRCEGAPCASSSVLCCVARLSAQKGLPLLIQAAAHLVLEGQSFQLLIIGDGEDRRLIEREIEQARLQSVVELAGVRSGSEVREALLRARALVLPSFAEGLPVVIMEAFALGRPVVSTRVAGVPELVDASCGWLVHPGSVEALVSAMRAALNASTDQISAMGLIGQGRVAQNYDSRKNASLLVGLMVESELNRGSGGARLGSRTLRPRPARLSAQGSRPRLSLCPR